MIVEVLEVAKVRRHRRRVQLDRRAKISVYGTCSAAASAAARSHSVIPPHLPTSVQDVPTSVQDVDGTGGEHGPEVVEVVAVFACAGPRKPDRSSELTG